MKILVELSFGYGVSFIKAKIENWNWR